MKRNYYKIVGYTLLVICLLLVVAFVVFIRFGSISMGHGEQKEYSKEEISKVNLVIVSESQLNERIRARTKNSLFLFWASWCLPCKNEMKALHTLSVKHQLDVILVSIDRNNEKQNQKTKGALLNNNNRESLLLDYPLGIDFNNANRFSTYIERIIKHKLIGLPVSLLVDSHGQVVAYQAGYSRDDSTSAYQSLDSLLSYTYK